MCIACYGYFGSFIGLSSDRANHLWVLRAFVLETHSGVAVGQLMYLRGCLALVEIPQHLYDL